ncbi:STAS/SEC14 domain-containing protein [Phenylobacterium sp.]|uniref:STAS/SEC14 domain-containing protein n=1 Tax=Phenylobacterium sp. TaxID=1871053 RepID=UPI0025CC8F17|nr:STAS/SEC14 domain-containing protein [Phenylobacterium sp.]MBX3484025.1 STAS/SEC14 domain-containing protein [Phenylobacterium sp.]MCW5760427.1 STAS/SEC14 domain-containing protein [Phenylobacterium sp.]
MIGYSTGPDSAVVEITVRGKVTDAELRACFEDLRADIEHNDKTRLLERIEHFTGIEPAALWTDIRVGPALARQVTRVAIVADSAWIRSVSYLGKFMTHAELKIFGPGELEQARAWVSAP